MGRKRRCGHWRAPARGYWQSPGNHPPGPSWAENPPLLVVVDRFALGAHVGDHRTDDLDLGALCDFDFKVFTVHGLGHLAHEPAIGDDRVTALYGAQHRLMSFHPLLLRAEDKKPEYGDKQDDGDEAGNEIHPGRTCGTLCVSGRNEHI